MSTSQRSWELKGTTLSYKIDGTLVAQIAGVSSDITVTTDGQITDGSVETYTDTDGAIVFKLANAALNNANVTLTNKSKTYSFKLALGNDVQGVSIETSTVGWDSSKIASAGTAYLKGTLTEGYTLKSNTSITYAAEKPNQTFATITGLNKTGVEVRTKDDNDNVLTPNVTLNGNTITLAKDALTNANVKLTNTNGGAYSLALASTGDGKVPTATTTTNIFALGATTTYKTVNTAYYTATNSTNIAYTAQKDVATLATIKGLAKTPEEDSVKADDSTGVITLGKGALNSANVSITLPRNATKEYTLALDEEVTPLKFGEVTKTAAVKNDNTTGTVTVTAKITAGYLPTTDGKSVIYRKPKVAGTEELIATIKGLATGKSADKVKGAITFDGMDKYGNIKVTLGAAALGTSSVTVTATGSGASYALDFDRNAVVDDTDAVVTKGVDVWRINGTTATYKTVIPAYYSYDATKNTIVYHKEADVKILAVVKGISDNLTVVDDTDTDSDGNVIGIKSSKIVDADGKEVIKIDGNKVITLTGGFDENGKPTGALAATNVTFDTKKTGSEYTLALDETEGSLAPDLADNPNYTWSVSGSATKTATLKGEMDPGFTVSGDKKTITYTAAKTGTKAVVLATISGLDKTVTVKDGILGTGSGNNFESARVEKPADDKVITLNDVVLGASNVVIAGNYGYTLGTPTGVLNATDAKTASRNSENWFWSFDKTTGTATYSQYTPEYYTLDSSGNAISYTEEAATKTLATLTGLARDLVLSDDGSSLGKWVPTYDEEGKVIKENNKVVTEFKPYVTLENGVITLTEEALNGEDVEVDGTGYTLSVDSEVIKEPAEEMAFSVNGTTATLRKGTSEGYTLSGNSKALEYSAKDDGSIVATITGLKSGLKAGLYKDKKGNEIAAIGSTKDKDGYVNPGLYIGTVENKNKKGEVVSNDNPAIILTTDVLGSGTVKISGTGGYQLDIDQSRGDEDTSPDGTLSPNSQYVTAWKSNGNTAILVPYTAEKWTETTTSATINKASVVDAVYEVKYTAAAKGETLATVTGLNGKALKVDASTGQIEGIDTTGVTVATDEETGKVTYSGDIELSNNVLNKTDVIVTNENGTKLASKVGLALSSDVTATSTTENDDGNYDSDKHNYVYTETITSTGYDDTDESGNILYRVAGKGTATISNVEDGAVTFDNGVFTIDTSEVYKKNKVPQTVTLTLSGKYNGGYTLGLDEDTAVDSTYNFAKDANKTAATYNRIDKGFSLSANAKSITYANDKKTVLATISGLDKNVILDEEGNIIETTTTTDENGEIITEETVKGKGITLSTDPETGDQIFTLDRAVLGANNVTLGKNDKFSLAINATDCAPDSVSPTLYVSKGTATVKEGTSAGWALTAPKTITYSKEKLTTLATISGLAAKLEDDQIADISFDAAKKVITFGAKALEGAKKLTLKDGTDSNYTLAINQTPDVIPTKYDTPKWTFSKGKAILQDGTSGGWVVTNSKNLTYQAAKLTNVATVTGLPNNLVEKDGKLYFPTTETVDGKEVTVADTSKGEALTFTPATYDSNGNLKTVGTIEVSKDLIDAGTDVLVKATKDTEAEYYLKKLALGAKDDYVFTFTDEAKEMQPETELPEAVITSNGTVEYKQDAEAGYVLADKSVTYTKETTNTLAKITGLPAGVFKYDKSGDNSVDDNLIYFNDDTKKITIYAEALEGITKNGAKVTLTSNDYALDLSDDVTRPTKLTDPKWTVSGTTATLKEGTSPGWNATSDKVLTFQAETADNTIAVVKGLKKGLKATDGKIEGISVYPTLKAIALASNVLGTTDVTLNADSEYSFDTEDLKKPSSDEPQWTVSKGTATLKQNITAGFTPTVDSKTLTYTAEKNGLVLATVTGLNASYNYASNQSALELDEENKTITVDLDALTNKKVAIKEKNSGYTLVLGNNAPTVEQTLTEWVISGTTATYKNYTKAYYKKNNSNNSIEFNAESKPIHTYLTITGLKKDAENITNFDEKNKVITLTDKQVGTSNITLKDGEYKDYTIKLAGSVDKVEYIIDPSDDENEKHTYGWSVTNGTAKLTGKMTAGFILAANGKSATYSKEKFSQTFATISGLKKGDEGVTVTEIESAVDEDGVITLTEDMLTNANVKLTNSNNNTYTLALDKDVNASHVLDKDSAGDDVFREDFDTATWTTKNGTATLKGVVSEGWKLTDSNNITYTKATATKTTKINGENTTVYTPQVLATVSGLVSNASLEAYANADADNTTIALKGSQLTSKVTISDTKGYYDFDFADDYNNSSIVGSAGADSISVGGTNMTVSLGKGNDYVEFGNHGNTFVYASGEGNDVIADFTVNNDKVKITSGKTISLTNEGNDTVIQVDKGSITLKDKTLSSFVYYDKNNNPVALTASADLMESDNFIAADSQLNELTGNYTNNALGDLNETQSLTGSDLTTLTKQSSLITYGSK